MTNGLADLHNNKKLAVTQSNRLIEARYSLTLNEQRIVLFMISLIHPEDEGFKDYEIKLSDVVRLAGLKNKNIYTELKDLLIGLRRREILIPEDDGFLVTGWVSSARYKENEGVVLLSFDAKLKPYLLKLKEQFTKYHLFHVTNFHSPYTIRIYMLLKQYEKIGFREFLLDEFKKILGIEDHKYQRFADFKKRVIDRALSEFSKKNEKGQYLSDITFQLETIRSGRKINRLRFIIEKQQVKTLQIELPLSQGNSTPSIIVEYEAYGISRSITLPHLKKQGEQALINCLNLFKEQQEKLDMGNPSGYLLGMLNNEAGKKTKAEVAKEKKKKKELQAKQEAEYQEKQQAQREKLERQFTKAETDKYLSKITKEEATKLLTQAKKENPMLSSMMTSLDSPMCLAFLLPRIPDYEKNKEAYIKQNLKL